MPSILQVYAFGDVFGTWRSVDAALLDRHAARLHLLDSESNVKGMAVSAGGADFVLFVLLTGWKSTDGGRLECRVAL